MRIGRDLRVNWEENCSRPAHFDQTCSLWVLPVDSSVVFSNFVVAHWAMLRGSLPEHSLKEVKEDYILDSATKCKMIGSQFGKFPFK